MSPIFVRPVREQLEHDRLIRHLVLKYKKKFDAAGNVGDEQVAPVKMGTTTYYPDVVLTEGKKLAAVIEVETAESVNNLEAMAQWVPFSRSRVPFFLYVPVQSYDVARRFCESHQAAVTEIWTYRGVADGFDLVRLFHDAGAAARKPSRKAEIPAKPSPPAVAKPVPAPPVKPAAKPAAKPAPKAAVKPGGKPEARPVGKADAKTATRADAKTATKADVKTGTKGDAKPAARADAKPAGKPEVKAAAKTSAKTPAKSAGKPAAKAPAKKPASAKAAPGRKR